MFSPGKWSGLDICAKCPISSVAHVINYSLHVSDKVGLLYRLQATPTFLLSKWSQTSRNGKSFFMLLIGAKSLPAGTLNIKPEVVKEVGE